jgi:hypothetical protein
MVTGIRNFPCSAHKISFTHFRLNSYPLKFSRAKYFQMCDACTLLNYFKKKEQNSTHSIHRAPCPKSNSKSLMCGWIWTHHFKKSLKIPKGVIRIRKSKDIHNGQKKKDISLKFNLFSQWYSWKIVELA